MLRCKYLFIFLLFVYVLSLTSNTLAEVDDQVGYVSSVLSGEGELSDVQFTSEGIARWRSKFPANPEAYLPIPVPKRMEPKFETPKSLEVVQQQNRIISYDPDTGIETINGWEDTNTVAPLADSVKGRKGTYILSQLGNAPELPYNFSGLSLVSNPEAYPWSVRVKIFFDQDTQRYECSGTLIDSSHVITAGHCVHAGNGGSWSSNVIVVPSHENRVYGDSYGVQLHSWTGWTTDGSYEHDIGVIDLDRPIGALTGWYGFGYNDDPSFYDGGGSTFHHAGYPGEAPYNGQYMYESYGYFDNTDHSWLYGWYGNEVSFDSCSYGGQSGSGASNSNILYAVISNTNCSAPVTNDVRVTSDKFGHIRDSFISDDTPSTFDLISLDTTTSPVTITAGNQLSSMTYLVHNYSSTSWSGTVPVKVYLSTNDIISTSDTLIQSHTFTWSFSPKSSVLINVSPPPTIPANIPAGNYTIGVLLDISDNNYNNNVSSVQDISPISVNMAAMPPVNLSLTPSVVTSASGIAKTFSAVYSDTNGYADLNQMDLLINTTVNAANGIYVIYDRATNKIFLINDAGTAGVGSCTPGTSGTLTNSQGSLNCAATTVSGAGNNLTVNWNITPKAAFTGTKNIYMYASDNAGATAGWTDKGDWTITAANVAPALETLTPSVVTSAPGIAKTFSAVYSDANGYADLNQMDLLINTTVNAANGIYVIYDRATNKIFLINDSGTAGVGSCTPGTSGTLTNSQGSLNCAATTVSGAGNNLTVNWNITPKAAFTSATAKNLYMYVRDMSNAIAGWTDKGEWTITAPNVVPTLETLTPSVVTSASGIAKTFSAVYSDANGYADLNQMDLLINTTVNAANGIYVIYDRATNKIFLINDSGTAGVGSCTPGTSGTLTNSQGSLNCAATTVSGTGSNVTVNWNITPKATFAGTKNIYMYASDNAGATGGWIDKGDWAITAANVAPTVGTLTPATLSSAVDVGKTFSTVYSDGNGYGDLNVTYLLINTSVNGANAIYVRYNRAGNKLYLRNDAGTADVGSCTPGTTGTLTNSQGSLNCAATTVSGTGNNLTVNWNITPKAAFAGTKNIYMYASDNAGATVGWADKGDWIITAGAVTRIVTPSAGPGGMIFPGTPQAVSNGAIKQFIVTPNTGYVIGSVGGTCGGSLSGNIYTTGPITASCIVSATFRAGVSIMNLGAPYPNSTMVSLAPAMAGYYYFDTTQTATLISVRMTTTDWTGNLDLMASNVFQPTCDQITQQSSVGMNGLWYGPGPSSNEGLNMNIFPPPPAGTRIYVTVCNRSSLNGGAQVYWY